MRENHETDSSYVPSVVSWTPIAIIAIIFMVLVIMGINAMNQAAELRAAEEKITALTDELAETSAKLVVAENQLAMPVYVEVVYDPNETIRRPADPINATCLQWRLGTIKDFETQLYAGHASLVVPINLMGYRVLLPNGGDMIGDTDLLPLAVNHAVDQREELFSEVDNSGFIDR